MSSDEPNEGIQGDGEDDIGPDAPLAPGVNRQRIPKRKPSSPPPQPPPPRLPRHWRRWAAGMIGVVVVIIIIASSGGGSSTPTTKAPTTPSSEPSSAGSNSASTSTTTANVTEKKAPAPPPATGPKVVWGPREVTIESGPTTNIDQFPLSTSQPTGFDIGFESEHGDNNLIPTGGGSVAVWSGHGEPHYTSCVNALASASEFVTLEGTGKWICAETATKRIARMRFDGSSGNSYRFDITVYQPGSG